MRHVNGKIEKLLLTHLLYHMALFIA